MKYTCEEYDGIIHDVTAQITAMRRLHVFGREPFMCDRVNCSYCPFIGDSGVCPDVGCPLDDSSKWKTARTAEEWQKWLEWFTTNNDPSRPVSVEITAEMSDALYLLYTSKRDLLTETERKALGRIIDGYREQVRD